MKLNNKRTFLVGLAFLSICAFWQMYDNIVPLILTNTFHMNETISGVIMAADNILALFLLMWWGTVCGMYIPALMTEMIMFYDIPILSFLVYTYFWNTIHSNTQVCYTVPNE